MRARTLGWLLGVPLALLLVLAAAVWGLDSADSVPANPPRQVSTDAATVERGRYLATVGNCTACHTRRGEPPMAGGEALTTPFGLVYGGNLTPHEATGLGRWSADDFWRAMHHGRSRDGRLLVPAFPYPEFTRITRDDSDALYAWLRTLAPVERANTPHALRFPYDTQAALKVWRALNFRPATFEPLADQSAAWNRGAYLVKGLAHCSACHGRRDDLGAVIAGREFDGGLIDGQAWYAPALTSSAEAGVADWPQADVVALLRDGVAPRGSVSGPMAEVVYRSTQHLTPVDLDAMAVFLKALPAHPPEEPPAPRPADARTLAAGGKLYEHHCATCHGDAGQGKPGAFPALAGNRAVVMADPTNLVRTILQGGYLPSTAGNPRPHGMPPFGHVLDDAQVASLATFVRGAWGNTGSSVNEIQIVQRRDGR